MSSVKHAVILAAGKSAKFFPPLYDQPKGLFVYMTGLVSLIR